MINFDFRSNIFLVENPYFFQIRFIKMNLIFDNYVANETCTALKVTVPATVLLSSNSNIFRNGYS